MVFAHASRSGGNCCSQPDCSVFIFPFTVGDQSRVGDSDCFSCLSQYLTAHSSVTTLLSPMDSAFSLQQNTCVESEEHTHTQKHNAQLPPCSCHILRCYASSLISPSVLLFFTFSYFLSHLSTYKVTHMSHISIYLLMGLGVYPDLRKQR